MQESKKHHHVPEFYLSRWCGDDGRVHVIRNINGKIVRGSNAPAWLGFEYYLYSYHENFSATDRSEIETKFFKPLDNAGARIVAKMIDGGELERQEIVLWTQFLTSMRLRNPENVEKVRSEWERLIVREMDVAQKEYAALRKDTDPETAMGWLQVNRPGFVESFGVGQLPKIASDPRTMQEIASFHWYIVAFDRSTKPLLTSDRPCVYTKGLDNPNCIIALPLSPRHAFFAFRPHAALQALLETPISCLAAALNDSVVRQAESRAYSQRKTDAPDRFFERRLRSSS